ncbi:MAG: pyruvate formate-lyase-activating protein [Firmicutes bacterium]|nr:pyruvate formate-lyase-activating protein [Bacillota bacterium]
MAIKKPTQLSLNVASIETLGTLDGPGLRTIIFFKGCPLRCKYCHNADMLSFEGGEKWTIDSLVTKCIKYKNFYGENGGVTLSGGEPLTQQSPSLVLLIKELQKKDIHVVLDTSGFPFSEEVLSVVDLVILDVKHTDKEAYLDLVGVPIDDCLKSLEYLKKIGKPFWVRQVIVEGITDNVTQILKLKELAQGAEKIELLAYHKMGVNKWKTLGLKYPLENIPATSKKTMDKLNALL